MEKAGQRHMGAGRHGMAGMDADHAADMDVLHFLLDHGDQIERRVERIEDGVRTVTESADPEIAAFIKKHVTSMYGRIKENRPIHQRDPLFQALFEHADQIEMTWVETARGVEVVETSTDPAVVPLIQAHADVVSLFIKNGRSEAMKNHTLP
jgi:hypothetical protein